jgi:hypothetical protein
VQVTLLAADGRVLAERVSLREGQSLSFDLGGGPQEMYLRKLVNVLIGEDWAVLDFSALAEGELRRIDRLLSRIANADATFVREGRDYSPAEAADHLRDKLAAAGPRITTLEEFIEHIASRSSTTGEPYRVRLADGTEMDARDWLTEEATRMDQEPPELDEQPPESRAP